MSTQDKKRSKYCPFRLSEPEYAILVKMASVEARKPSELMRDLVREGAYRRGLLEVDHAPQS